MDIDFYQEKATELAVYADQGNNLVYPVLGLIGEAGEVAEKVKKLWRNRGIMGGAANLTPEEKESLVKELGDVTWYCAAFAKELGVNLSDVLQTNLNKLWDRRDRNVIKGEGDNR